MEALKGKRSYIKGQITRIDNFVRAIKDDTSVDELTVRLEKIQQLYKDFVNVEYQMLELSDTVQTDIEAIDAQYYSIVAKLQGAMRKSTTNNSPAVNFDQTLNNTQTYSSDFRLPRITIPPFDGNYKEWQSFFDLFGSTVHENGNISPAQKFQYLKGLLRGEALALVRHFQINDANYIEAYQKLCKRYDKKQYIVDSFIQTYFEQPTVTQATSQSIAQLHDTCDEVVRGLKALGPEAESRDPWLIYIATQKMDAETRQMWKLETSEIKYPTFEKLLAVLNKRMDALQGVKSVSSKPVLCKQKTQLTKSMHTAPAVTCAFCGKDHKLFECDGFRGLELQQRRDYVKKHSRCYNCLSDTHMVYQCKSKRKCSLCQRKHHDILHLELPTASSKPTTCAHASSVANAILPTAQIAVERYNGEWQLCRALLDSGSQTSFVTEECFQRLGLKKTKGRIWIQGLNDVNSGVSKGVATLQIKSRFPDDHYEAKVKVLIVPKISSYQPSISEIDGLQELAKLKLADPKFQKNNKIDVLLGSDLFFDIISDGKKYLPKSKLVAHNTKLGWVIAGTPMEHDVNNKEISINLHLDVDQTLRKFWEIEEIANIVPYSEEEKFCLEHYQRTVQRSADGRYIVSLPFKKGLPKWGNSKILAVKRLGSLEKRFVRDSSFKRQYAEFLDEYLALEHMKISNDSSPDEYYLPHHGVLKESSTTTKLRVVFDGSAKTTFGNSLNDELAVGPVVQSSLVELLLRFRRHKIIFTADIEKMFRQIWVSNKDSDYQKIVWRKEQQDVLQSFKLLTVTYGTTSAPFLATQTLNQLASDYQTEYPEAAEIVRHDFYVDDLMSGASNLKDAQRNVKDLVCLLRKGGFNLRKWASNSSELLHSIPEANRNVSIIDFDGESQAVSVLGVRYSPVNDTFQFKVTLVTQKLTKRNMLSEASKLFDPIGWLSPTTVKIKILFQKLWLLGVDWDDLLPDSISQNYEAIRQNLIKLEEIRINRWLFTDGQELELHGFADASELAYAAVIYSRVKTKNGYKTNLVTAKTKVAPIKAVSIPRLELCAAVLLTKLMSAVLEMFKNTMIINYHLWTDSTIVLHWLSSCPRRWQTYVANRVSFVLQSTNRNQWRHVPSNENPADCASRGLLPDELVNHSLWWNGPHWLRKPEMEWTVQTNLLSELPEQALKEQKNNSVALTNTEHSSDWLFRLIQRCSKFSKVLSVITRILILFRNKSSHRTTLGLESSSYYNKAKVDSFNFVIKQIQLSNFAAEISALTKNKLISKGSKLTSFFPFVDKYGLLRVGGRLCNADLPYETKHPIILPARNYVTSLIIRDEHLRLLHAGPTLLMSTLKQKYNIMRCKDEVRGVIGRCIKCIRLKAQQQQQLMGQLPQPRVSFHRPFFTTGVDYAGPLLIKTSKLRQAKSIKAYLALFVCMATKAVHLELVSDMTTEAFLAALRRFHARRGICAHIYSDNGTNFVGAQRDLQRNVMMVSKDAAVMRYVTNNNIEWHFIPPGAPNFGGLWEAGVKSCKYYLKRVLGETLLTFEEMTTLLTQIEAILNSRPLCEISSDELDPLTPGHFLIGHALTLLPEPHLLDVKENRLSRWQHIQRMVQHFWQKWHNEYLLTLQQRTKWKYTTNNPKPGDLVVVMDKDTPPTKWLMGRIVKTVPGQDGLVRVVYIRTKLGEIKRPITKICIFMSSGSVEPTGAGCSGSC